MYCVSRISDDLYWVGGNDRRLALFENVFPIPRGISYNAYLLLDEKTVLLDTVDHSVSRRLFENLEHLLAGRPLDYLVITHMEPDHCATVEEVVRRYPELRLVGNAKTIAMLKQYFTFDVDSRALLVKEGDQLAAGRHSLSFYMAPMVHWPEVMVVYDSAEHILFSADAFGTFGALSGNLFADEVDFPGEWLAEARRYYANIVGKYGSQTLALLKKAAGLDIRMICPLHGPVWRENIGWYVDKYQAWGSYTPEERAVLIAYASVYGNTENAAEILAVKLAQAGIRKIAMHDVSVTHPSYLLSEAFRCSHLVLISTTYNAGIFFNMEMLLLDLKEHNLQNRTVAIIENGSWAPMAGKLMREMVCGMKNMTLLEPTLSIRSSLKQSQLPEMDALAAAIAASVREEQAAPEQPKRGYVCRLCGYVYAGETLPPDFTCPLCKRGADSFELKEL